ncbi:MAG TPA: hypothetical protein VFQ59_03200 [Candidatus Paceibacterota bacterium]|nr:hypothetical protein [Candidatus Paceibacterota bacterium]
MKKTILINKQEGETPLEALEKFRRKNPEYKNLPITYAGRLDPMASGLLLLLAGEETKQKEKYLGLTKEYKFSVLFGFATDTFDILGKVVDNMQGDPLKGPPSQSEGGPLGKGAPYTFRQTYPAYSSKTVKGRPLFDYARKGEAVEAQTREVTVTGLKQIKSRKISANVLLKNIERRIKKVKGDFRQQEILKIWRKHLSRNDKKYVVVDFHIKCSSGTYVRSIAEEMGKKIGVPALAFFIERTRIGKWYKM